MARTITTEQKDDLERMVDKAQYRAALYGWGSIVWWDEIEGGFFLTTGEDVENYGTSPIKTETQTEVYRISSENAWVMSSVLVERILKAGEIEVVENIEGGKEQ